MTTVTVAVLKEFDTVSQFCDKKFRRILSAVQYFRANIDDSVKELIKSSCSAFNRSRQTIQIQRGGARKISSYDTTKTIRSTGRTGARSFLFGVSRGSSATKRKETASLRSSVRHPINRQKQKDARSLEHGGALRGAFRFLPVHWKRKNYAGCGRRTFSSSCYAV